LQNPYWPYPVRIDQITTETEDEKLKTFKMVFLNPDDEEKFPSGRGSLQNSACLGRGKSLSDCFLSDGEGVPFFHRE